MKNNAAKGYEKTNPIQSQFPKSQNECKLTYNKGLQKKRHFRSPKKQTQFKSNLRKAKMNVNLTLTKDYRKNDDFAVRINKPNSNPKQTQSKPVLSAVEWANLRSNDCKVLCCRVL